VGRPSKYPLLRRETELYSKARDGSARASAHHTALEAFSHLTDDVPFFDVLHLTGIPSVQTAAPGNPAQTKAASSRSTMPLAIIQAQAPESSCL
jgi:hypothetical protein